MAREATASVRTKPTVTPRSGKSIAERIKKPSPKIGHVALTIYGRGGVGKTTLLRTMPGKGLVVDIPTIEGGTMVLSPDADRIDIIECHEWADFDDVYNYLREGQHQYKWVAIDSISAAQKLAKRKTMKERDLSSDPAQMTMQDWGKIANLMEELFYRFKQLPLHLIFIAQEKARETDTGREYQPSISPASLDALIPSMFLVGRLYTKERDVKGKIVIQRHLRVGPHAYTVTKTRTLPDRPLPSVIEEPNLQNILRYILGAEGEKVPKEAKIDDLTDL